MRIILIFSLIIITLCCVCGITSSSEAGFTSNSFNLLPDSPFYPLSRSLESIRFMLIKPQKRAGFRMLQAEERLLEAEMMISREKGSYAAALLEESYLLTVNSIHLTPALIISDNGRKFNLKILHQISDQVRVILRNIL